MINLSSQIQKQLCQSLVDGMKYNEPSEADIELFQHLVNILILKLDAVELWPDGDIFVTIGDEFTPDEPNF